MILSKEEMMKMAQADLEKWLQIIGDLGTLGYRVSLSRLHGFSLQQCALKHRTTKKIVRSCWAKCVRFGHDKELIRIFSIEKKETFVLESVSKPDKCTKVSSE